MPRHLHLKWGHIVYDGRITPDADTSGRQAEYGAITNADDYSELKASDKYEKGRFIGLR